MDPSSRQAAGINTRLAVRYVRAHAGEEGVSEMLRLAGETRSAQELEDERTWSTYGQLIRLFEAAAGAPRRRPGVARRGGARPRQRGGAADTTAAWRRSTRRGSSSSPRSGG